ncbi:hypothetical protein AVEN_182435-1 [Araneus ventricosus]|uniref:Uncharacterized protein n=1 Tax=Araneus ventricosus TaxID=182803 RepID=A0A4Y2NNR5_ARAVE|nr:hypothetical protein AVEN_18386-1 [Araneus ventricosus]GBN39431.1 hypothetical protein AVEN_182435-1 [Araneus ventricosus]
MVQQLARRWSTNVITKVGGLDLHTIAVYNAAVDDAIKIFQLVSCGMLERGMSEAPSFSSDRCSRLHRPSQNIPRYASERVVNLT